MTQNGLSTLNIHRHNSRFAQMCLRNCLHHVQHSQPPHSLICLYFLQNTRLWESLCIWKNFLSFSFSHLLSEACQLSFLKSSRKSVSSHLRIVSHNILTLHYPLTDRCILRLPDTNLSPQISSDNFHIFFTIALWIVVYLGFLPRFFLRFSSLSTLGCISRITFRNRLLGLSAELSRSPRFLVTPVSSQYSSKAPPSFLVAFLYF